MNLPRTGYERVGVATLAPPVVGSEKGRRRRAVVRRDGERCASCGVTENLTIDHIIPRSRGGSNRIANLQLLCVPCNSEKGDTFDPDLVTKERLRVGYAMVNRKHGPVAQRIERRIPNPTGGGSTPSRPVPETPKLEPLFREDGETLEAYALRLEKRIAVQRVHLDRHNELRKDEGNRADRKRIAALERALGSMTLRWEAEKQNRLALVAMLRDEKTQRPSRIRAFFARSAPAGERSPE